MSSGEYHDRRSTERSGRRSGGFLGRRKDEMDPSIRHAKERVMSAEQAEMEADRARDQARLRVEEARHDVKALEAEAKEDARRAKMKQQQYQEISKRGKGLGRHL